jgi:hypothetical protein
MHEQCKVGLGQIKTGSELLAIMTGKVKREAFYPFDPALQYRWRKADAPARDDRRRW